MVDAPALGEAVENTELAPKDLKVALVTVPGAATAAGREEG